MNHYKKVRLSADKTMDEHRYKMQVHLGRELGYNEIVHHDDEIKTNNALSNLSVVSRSEHSRMHRIGKKMNAEFREKMRLKGIAQMPNKLSADQVNEIRLLHSQGTTQVELSKQYNVNKTTICDIVNIRTWKHIVTILLLLTLFSCSVPRSYTGGCGYKQTRVFHK